MKILLLLLFPISLFSQIVTFSNVPKTGYTTITCDSVVGYNTSYCIIQKGEVSDHAALNRGAALMAYLEGKGQKITIQTEDKQLEGFFIETKALYLYVQSKNKLLFHE